MVDMERGVMDHVKMFQQETLAVTRPPGCNPCLENYEYGFQQKICMPLTKLYHCLISFIA